MKKTLLISLILISFTSLFSQHVGVAHVYVALCDNVNQGIVPVPSKIGNGQDPYNNLYWGCAYGVKSFLKNKQPDWELVKSIQNPAPKIYERVVFYNQKLNAYIVADAYDGAEIKQCTIDFMRATNGQNKIELEVSGDLIRAGGDADLTAYVGHDGLMDFDVEVKFDDFDGTINHKEFIILACYSRNYFQPYMKETEASPRLWTTHLMAPEAYTLVAGIESYFKGDSGTETREVAAQAYNKYQNCGINGARNLFVSDWK